MANAGNTVPIQTALWAMQAILSLIQAKLCIYDIVYFVFISIDNCEINVFLPHAFS